MIEKTINSSLDYQIDTYLRTDNRPSAIPEDEVCEDLAVV